MNLLTNEDIASLGWENIPACCSSEFRKRYYNETQERDRLYTINWQAWAVGTLDGTMTIKDIPAPEDWIKYSEDKDRAAQQRHDFRTIFRGSVETRKDFKRLMKQLGISNGKSNKQI